MEIGHQLGDGQADLLHGVAVADGDAAVAGRGFVADGLEVDGDAVRGADLVLAAIALADGPGLVVIDHEVLGEHVADLLGLLTELLGQRQDGALVRREGGMQVHDDADVVVALLVLADDLLVIGIDEEGQGDAVGAEGRLDDVGDVVLVRLGVVIGHVLAGGGLMRVQVEVGAAGHAPQLAPAEGEVELEVGGGVGVMGQLLGVVVAQAQLIVAQAEVEQPLVAEVLPVGEPGQLGAGLAEELQLHLLELTDAEDEVARGDLVAEGLADLADAEGELAAGGPLDGREVHEDALCGLGTEVDGVLRVLGDALEGLEHQVELTDIGEVMLAAGGAGNVVLLDEVLHLALGEGIDGLGQLEGGLAAPILNELVRAEALVALAAVHQRIGEAAQVAGGDPGLRVHEDGGVKADVIGVLLHELLPPGALDVVLQLDAERAVVPGVGEAAVDLGAGEDEASVLAQSHDPVHGFFGIFHVSSFPAAGCRRDKIFVSRQTYNIPELLAYINKN